MEERPSTSGKGKQAYQEAVRAAAAREIAEPIGVADVEVEVVYSTLAKPAERMDADNVNKPTLDALKGVAYADDAQVRSVTATIFDRNSSHRVTGRVEHMGPLFYSPHPDVVLIMITATAACRNWVAKLKFSAGATRPGSENSMRRLRASRNASPHNKRMQLTAPLGAAPARLGAAPRARPSASTGAAADPRCSADVGA